MVWAFRLVWRRHTRRLAAGRVRSNPPTIYLSDGVDFIDNPVMDDHLKQLLLLGREHYAKGEFVEAEGLLKQVLEATTQYADVFDMLGVIAHSQGKLEEARAHFEHAIAINPNYTEAQLNLMVTLNDMGEYQVARELYSKLQKRGSSDREADPFIKGKIANMHAETSVAYQDIGMYQDAILELEKAITLCPGFADLRTRLGVLYRDRGELVKAREQFEAAKQANPRYLQARLLLGVLLLTAGDADEAEQEFDAVLELEPGHRGAEMYKRIAASTKAAPDATS